jgi:POT family proton-dependent oligopeptide transporter
MVQIFNGVFVFAFAFPFSIMWDKLRAKGKEPLSTMKQAIGLGLIALSYFIIAHNVKDLGNSGLLAIKWLILLYLIQTFAELCLSPIGLSLVGKLSPKRFSSLLFGVFFLSNAAGYALAGSLGALIPATGDKFKKAQELGIDLQSIIRLVLRIRFLQVSKFIICTSFLWYLWFLPVWPPLFYFYSHLF